MNQLISEEIKRIMLLSKYDNSKTLSEQNSNITPEMEIAYDFYDKGAKGGGTDSELMASAIEKITSADQFWKVNDVVKKNSNGMSIADVINDEFDSDNQDDLNKIFIKLRSFGIKSSYQKDADGEFIDNTFKLTTAQPTTGAVATAATTALPDWTKNFPCLSDIGTITKYNQNAVNHTYDTGDFALFYDDKRYIYQYSNKSQLKGTWDCVSGKLLIKTEDGEQWQKDTKWVKQKTNTANTAKKQVATPAELKDIKAFQDWLDTNAPGWATGYTDGIINKGQNGGGYGKYGPRTQKAWATYKDKYLNSGTEVSGENNTQTATATAGKLEPASGAVYGNEYVANDGKTYVWNGTEYQVKA